jgi:hypothetical protein
MPSEEPGNATGHVLRFERRGGAALRGRTPFAASSPSRRSPVEDIDRYAYRDENAEDDRHRMIANGVATVILLILIVCGIWLADTIAKIRDTQDCVLSGRSNCAPIEHANRSQ